MNAWIPRLLSLFLKPFRTQLPGETTMTPPPHIQLAHQGPPAGDTLHRAATTAASKLTRKGHCWQGHDSWCPSMSMAC
ncbi:hypothetical protein GOODEAATRI_000235 [Goodea atripinnis]|uniref:Uncharacterized protein n=1 Tax=Goodea atripinnis TaxID=208336 RepID=A0ABV0NGC0_9TELE